MYYITLSGCGLIRVTQTESVLVHNHNIPQFSTKEYSIYENTGVLLSLEPREVTHVTQPMHCVYRETEHCNVKIEFYKSREIIWRHFSWRHWIFVQCCLDSCFQLTAEIDGWGVPDNRAFFPRTWTIDPIQTLRYKILIIITYVIINEWRHTQIMYVNIIQLRYFRLYDMTTISLQKRYLAFNGLGFLRFSLIYARNSYLVSNVTSQLAQVTLLKLLMHADDKQDWQNIGHKTKQLSKLTQLYTFKICHNLWGT